MLVLSRLKDESIIITVAGTCIEVMILNAYSKVSLGITAPKTVTVHRKEIQEIIDREKEEQNATKSNNTN